MLMVPLLQPPLSSADFPPSSSSHLQGRCLKSHETCRRTSRLPAFAVPVESVVSLMFVMSGAYVDAVCASAFPIFRVAGFVHVSNVSDAKDTPPLDKTYRAGACA